MKPLLVIAPLLSGALFGCASSAQISDSCAALISRTELQTIARTNPLGSMRVFGRPYAIEPGMLRAEVDVYGGDNPIYSVDVKVDGACNVISISSRLVSRSDPGW